MPKILNFVKIIHYHSKFFTGVLRRVTEAEAESQDGALGPDSCKPSTTDNPAPAAADIERSFFFSQCLLSQGVAYTVVLYVQDAATGSAVVSFVNFTVPSDPKLDLTPS